LNKKDVDDDVDSLRTEITLGNGIWVKIKTMLSQKYAFDEESLKQHLNEEIDAIVILGINQLLSQTSSSTSLLRYDGRPPRADVLHNLNKIANTLLNNDAFPYFHKSSLISYSKNVLGSSDNRTLKKYWQCMENHSEKDYRKGMYDVTVFCKLATMRYDSWVN